jgi:hypothetical protein
LKFTDVSAQMLAALPLWALPAPPPETALNQFKIGLNLFRIGEQVQILRVLEIRGFPAVLERKWPLEVQQPVLELAMSFL